jgi:hypothetical protein
LIAYWRLWGNLRVCTANGGSVFQCYNGTDLQTTRSLSGGNYANNIEYGPTGKIYAGRNAPLGTDIDAWVFDPASGNKTQDLDVEFALNDRQLVVSGDGQRVIMRHNGRSKLTIVGVMP